MKFEAKIYSFYKKFCYNHRTLYGRRQVLQMTNLTEKENEFFKNQVEKFKTFRKPNQSQQLLIALYDIQNKSEDDFKKIRVLLNAEKKYLQALKANKAIKDLLKADKEKERKALEHKKFMLGGGLWAAIKDDRKINQSLNYRQLIEIMISQKLLNPFDKEGNNLFSEFLISKQEDLLSPIENQSNFNNNANE